MEWSNCWSGSRNWLHIQFQFDGKYVPFSIFTYKAFPNFLKYLAATDNVVYEGTSDITYNDGSIWTRKVSINESIASATTYEFSVKIIVDNIQTLTSDGTYEFTEMESEEGSVKCYTNPAQLLGIH